MPIRADLRHHYQTPAWFEAREKCRERAGDRCQRCNARNGATGYREGRKFIEISPRDAELARMQGHRVILIQCGCCHRSPVPPMDYRIENLVWLCRGCHLKWDMRLHKRSRQTRRDGQRPILILAGACV
jgi:hypothetical protein